MISESAPGILQHDPATYGTFQQHKDNGLVGCLRNVQIHKSRQRVRG
jgi:hypothetical protein